MVCELTQMEVSNASCMMVLLPQLRQCLYMLKHLENDVLVSSTLNPKIIEVIQTYAKYRHQCHF